jgi:hypothetical protein
MPIPSYLGEDPDSEPPAEDLTPGADAAFLPGGPTTLTPYPEPAFVLSEPGEGLHVLLFDSLGNRKALPQEKRYNPTYTLDRLGGFGQGGLSTAAESFTLPGDRVEMWQDDALHYRGYVAERDTSGGDPSAEEVTLYGRAQVLTKILADKLYRYGVAVDASLIAEQVWTDWIEPLFPWLTVQFETTGVELLTFDSRGKTVSDVLSGLAQLCGGGAVWGVDYDPADGKDRLYFRPASGDPDYTIAVPSAGVGKVTGSASTSDLVNVLTVDGGDMGARGNKLKNGGFEAITPGGGGTGLGSLLENGDFEQDSHQEGAGPGVGGGINEDPTPGRGYTAYWALFDGASMKQNGQDVGVSAHSGQWLIQTDTVGEGFRQEFDVPVESRGHKLRVGFYVNRQGSASQEAEVRMEWRVAGVWQDAADAGTTDGAYTLVPLSNHYERYERPFLCPALADKGRLTATHTVAGGGAGVGEGLLWDNLELWDTERWFQENWKTTAYGDEARVIADWAYGADRVHGGYAIRLRPVGAADADGQDGHLEPIEKPSITPGLPYRFTGWVRTGDSAEGDAGGKQIYQIQWRKTDNTVLDATVKVTHTALAAFGWTFFNVTGTAPADAAYGIPFVAFRSDGDYIFDALWFGDARARWGPNLPYQPDGPLSARLRAADVFESGAEHDSETLYGTREGRESAQDVTDLDTAVALARAFFRSRAIPVRKATVPLSGDADRLYWPGQVVRLAGEEGPTHAPSPLPVARVRGSFDGAGVFSRTLELGREQPTTEALINQIAVARAAAFNTRQTATSP